MHFELFLAEENAQPSLLNAFPHFCIIPITVVLKFHTSYLLGCDIGFVGPSLKFGCANIDFCMRACSE